MSEYLPCVLAVVLIRESLDESTRAAFAEATRHYVALRDDHAVIIRAIEAQRGVDYGLRIAEVHADAAADIVARIFEGGVPNTEHTAVLSPSRPDYLIATTVQHAYDLLGVQDRLRFKAKVRDVVKLAGTPLDAEVAYILQLLDSWEAWELEQQLS